MDRLDRALLVFCTLCVAAAVGYLVYAFTRAEPTGCPPGTGGTVVCKR